MRTHVVSKPKKPSPGAGMEWVYDLYRIGHVIGEAPVEAVRERILEHVVAGFNASTGCLALADDRAEQLTIVATKGLPPQLVGNRIDIGSGIMGKVAQDREPLLLNGDLPHANPARKSVRPKSAICWPLVMDNRVIGALSVNRRANETPFAKGDLERGRVIVSMIAVAVENTRLHGSGHQGGGAGIDSALLAACQAQGGVEVAKALGLSPDDAMVAALEVFCNLLGNRSQTLAARSLTMAGKAVELARELGEPDTLCRDVQAAALLHDIGRVGFSDRHLESPEDRLSGDDLARARRHPVLGQALMACVPSLGEAAQLVRHHHEDFDGNGYPDGLAGGDIPIGARIVRVVADFYGLQDGIVQDGKLSPDQAGLVISQGRGKVYDPTAAKLFLDLVGLGEGDETEVSEWCLKVPELKPGMVVIRTVKLAGETVLAKGALLDSAEIQRLGEVDQGADEELTVYVRF